MIVGRSNRRSPPEQQDDGGREVEHEGARGAEVLRGRTHGPPAGDTPPVKEYSDGTWWAKYRGGGVNGFEEKNENVHIHRAQGPQRCDARGGGAVYASRPNQKCDFVRDCAIFLIET